MKAWHLSLIFQPENPNPVAFFRALRLWLSDENIAANESGGV